MLLPQLHEETDMQLLSCSFPARKTDTLSVSWAPWKALSLSTAQEPKFSETQLLLSLQVLRV